MPRSLFFLDFVFQYKHFVTLIIIWVASINSILTLWIVANKWTEILFESKRSDWNLICQNWPILSRRRRVGLMNICQKKNYHSSPVLRLRILKSMKKMLRIKNNQQRCVVLYVTLDLTKNFRNSFCYLIEKFGKCELGFYFIRNHFEWLQKSELFGLVACPLTLFLSHLHLLTNPNRIIATTVLWERKEREREKIRRKRERVSIKTLAVSAQHPSIEQKWFSSCDMGVEFYYFIW